MTTRYVIVQVDEKKPPPMKPHYDDLSEATAAILQVRKSLPPGVTAKLVQVESDEKSVTTVELAIIPENVVE